MFIWGFKTIPRIKFDLQGSQEHKNVLNIIFSKLYKSQGQNQESRNFVKSSEISSNAN